MTGLASARRAAGGRLRAGGHGRRVGHDRRDPHGRPAGRAERRIERRGDRQSLGVLAAVAQGERTGLVAPAHVAVELAGDGSSRGADGERLRPGLDARARPLPGRQHERLREAGADGERRAGHLGAGVQGVARGHGARGEGELSVGEGRKPLELGLRLLDGHVLRLCAQRRAVRGAEHLHRGRDAERHHRDRDQHLDEGEACFVSAGRPGHVFPSRCFDLDAPERERGASRLNAWPVPRLNG